jgi:hypothetical protein
MNGQKYSKNWLKLESESEYKTMSESHTFFAYLHYDPSFFILLSWTLSAHFSFEMGWTLPTHWIWARLCQHISTFLIRKGLDFTSTLCGLDLTDSPFSFQGQEAQGGTRRTPLGRI